MKKVFIYPGDSYHAAIEMFERRGFEVVKDYEKVDLVCFLGGTDVDPLLYGGKPGPYTQSPDKARDVIEVAGFHRFADRDVPMVGICRGGQLLNVLNGGKMIQHLGEYVSGDVAALGYGDDRHLELRVDHHQGILLDETKAYRLAVMDAWPCKEVLTIDYAGYYPETKSLCFQPHPEWGHQGTEDYFFELIEEYLGLKGAA